MIITCNCGNQVQIPPGSPAGMQYQCPHCQAILVVGHPIPPGSADPTPAAPNRKPLIIGGIAALLVVAIVVISNPGREKGGDDSSTGDGPGRSAPDPGPGGKPVPPPPIAERPEFLDWPEDIPAVAPGSLRTEPTVAPDFQALATPFSVRKPIGPALVSRGGTVALPVRLGDGYRFDLHKTSDGKRLLSLPKELLKDELLDLAPAGDRVAIAHEDTVSIYEIPSDKPSARFAPFGEERPRKEVEHGWFVGDEKILLHGGTGDQFGLWNLREEKFEWLRQVPGYGSPGFAISPGRSFLLVSTAGEVLVFDVDTGTAHGTLPTPAAMGKSSFHNFKEVCFSPDGKLLAASFGSSPNNVPAAVWDLTEARLLGEFEVNKKLSAIFDERYLLYGDYSTYWIFDMQEQRDTWVINVKGEPSAFAMHAGQAWFVSSFAPPDPDVYLAAAAIDPAALIASAKSPAEAPILDRGAKIALEIGGDSPRSDPGFGDRIAAKLTGRLGERGFEVAEGGEVTCRVEFSLDSTGRKRRYSPDGITRKDSIEIPEQRLVFSVEIVDGDGRVLWRNSRTAYQAGLVKGSSASEISAEVLGKQWARTGEMADALDFPPRLWKQSARGSSKLTKDGFEN